MIFFCDVITSLAWMNIINFQNSIDDKFIFPFSHSFQNSLTRRNIKKKHFKFKYSLISSSMSALEVLRSAWWCNKNCLVLYANKEKYKRGIISRYLLFKNNTVATKSFFYPIDWTYWYISGWKSLFLKQCATATKIKNIAVQLSLLLLQE